MSRYISADKLIAEIERLKSVLIDPLCSQGNILGPDWVAGGNKMLNEISSVVTSLQQEQPKKSIEINGIRYKEVPAKTNDKICKDCDYFLDNGSCNLDVCPCACDDNILERIQQKQPQVADASKTEQPEVDLEKEMEECLGEN